MKLLLLMLALIGASAQAIIIPIDLGPPREIIGPIVAQMDITTDALAGTPLAGQSLSLDFQFHNFLRLYPTPRYAERQLFSIGFAALPFVNALDSTSTGYMVNADGSHGPSTTITGGFGGLAYPPVRTEITWWSGMHFDLTLPDLEGAEITGLTVHFDMYDFYSHARFNITDTASLPESGTTLGLLTLALCGVVWMRRYA